MMAHDRNDREVRLRKARVHVRSIKGFLMEKKDHDGICQE